MTRFMAEPRLSGQCSSTGSFRVSPSTNLSASETLVGEGIDDCVIIILTAIMTVANVTIATATAQ